MSGATALVAERPTEANPAATRATRPRTTPQMLMNLDQLIEHLESLRDQVGGSAWVEDENGRAFSVADVTVKETDTDPVVQFANP